MSDPILARYDFVSFFRRGAAADLTGPDPLAGPVPHRGSLTVDVTLRSSDDGATRDDPATSHVQLYGPGDVVGIDPRHVIRTDPRDGTPSFEPNYFPAIEFDHPDFPWLFTPASESGAKLRPWLCLLVLADDEFTTPSDRKPEPLPAIRVTSASVLPDLTQSWAWAHVQVSGGIGSSNVGAIEAADPARALSRLICPRRLEPRTHYTALLVPAFDLGVKAGLGETIPPATVTTDPAWPPGDAKLLPVYYRFEFITSARGDFETLVRQLQPRRLPAQVGMRQMLVDRPGWGARGAGPPLGLSGALRSLETVDTPWAGPARSAFQADLTALVNRAATPLDDPAHDPVVVPPLYGRWHAARSTVDPSASGWFDALNTDPRTRSMAGFGTRVVLDQRAQLMASAWQQVEGIERANQLLRQAQVAKGASEQVHARHLGSIDAATAMILTAPLHARLSASPRTVHATIADSRLPVRALSPAFRRIARPRGSVRRRHGAGALSTGGVVSRLASGELSPTPPVRPPDGMVSLEQVGDRILPAWLRGLRRLWRGRLWIALAIVLALLLLIALLALLVGAAAAIALAVAAIAAAAAIGARLRPLLPQLAAAEATELSALTQAAARGAPPRPDFVVTEPGDAAEPPAAGPGPSRDSRDAADFREAAARLAGALAVGPPPVRARPAAEVGRLSRSVLEAVAPARTFPARIRAAVALQPAGLATVSWNPETLDEIMAAPTFPQPMYEPLRDLSPDYLLPGLDEVPADTLGLLVENHAFIESYMVGLNHEMARALLWNEYPTDQRSSYFRQFWDVRGYVPQPGDPSDPDELRERLHDVPQVHRWPRPRQLGQNRNRPHLGPDKLVLLVRGELLRRYPNAIVYACEARWDAAARRHSLGDAEKYPQYRGTLPPDVTFFGFDLTAPQALGEQRNRSRPQGWFFVFQEQPTEPRFGLDAEPEPFSVPAVHGWNDLSWANFAASAAELAGLRYARADRAPANVTIAAGPDNPNDPANAWGADAAQTAYIALQRPVRVAVHARTMLPRPS